jgi:cyclic pyranopterin phosphate synthase
MARDAFLREIDYLRISVTDRCNMGCIYCVPGNRPRLFNEDRLLSAKEIARLARVALSYGVRKIRLTGGEPLLREDILEIIGRIKRAGVRNLSLTTNGSLLAGMARPLREAGLERANVSLDTMDPAKYAQITGGGNIDLALEGIREAENAGLEPVKLNVVPMRGINDDEITAFARLTLEKPLHVRFIELMPSAGDAPWQREKCVTSKEVMDKVSGIGELERLRFRGRGPSRNYRIKGAEGVLGFISPVSRDFCYSCNRLRINAVGGIRPCLFSRTEVDVASPMRGGAGDDELRRLFALAIDIKPEGNYLGRPSGAALEGMSCIGG